MNFIQKRDQKITQIDGTLKERNSNYGSFETESEIAMKIKFILRSAPNWTNLRAFQQHALDAIVMKMARAVNGNATYADTYHDIAGYAALVEKILNEDPLHSKVQTPV